MTTDGDGLLQMQEWEVDGAHLVVLEYPSPAEAQQVTMK